MITTIVMVPVKVFCTNIGLMMVVYDLFSYKVPMVNTRRWMTTSMTSVTDEGWALPSLTP